MTGIYEATYRGNNAVIDTGVRVPQKAMTAEECVQKNAERLSGRVYMERMLDGMNGDTVDNVAGANCSLYLRTRRGEVLKAMKENALLGELWEIYGSTGKNLFNENDLNAIASVFKSSGVSEKAKRDEIINKFLSVTVPNEVASRIVGKNYFYSGPDERERIKAEALGELGFVKNQQPKMTGEIWRRTVMVALKKERSSRDEMIENKIYQMLATRYADADGERREGHRDLLALPEKDRIEMIVSLLKSIPANESPGPAGVNGFMAGPLDDESPYDTLPDDARNENLRKSASSVFPSALSRYETESLKASLGVVYRLLESRPDLARKSADLSTDSREVIEIRKALWKKKGTEQGSMVEDLDGDTIRAAMDLYNYKKGQSRTIFKGDPSAGAAFYLNRMDGEEMKLYTRIFEVFVGMRYQLPGTRDRAVEYANYNKAGVDAARKGGSKVTYNHVVDDEQGLGEEVIACFKRIHPQP